MILNAGDLILIPPDIAFQTNFRHQDGPLRAYLFFFSPTLVAEFEQSAEPSPIADEGTVVCLSKRDRMSTLIHSMDEVYAGTRSSNAVVKLKLLELLHFIADNAGLGKTKRALYSDRERVTNIRKLMQSQFAPKLTVADYANIAGRPIASFNRDFKRAFGMPPGKWIFQEKMRHAERLLSTEAMAVTEVALQLEYQSVSHFIERFRKHFGETPRQYQRRVISNNSVPLK